MKIPLTWLKDYLDLDKSPKEIAASFTSLGLMLDKPLEGNVLDLEHRMDRADWLSIVGCARDLAAFEGLSLKEPKRSVKPGKLSTADTIAINVESSMVHRFNTRRIKGLKVGDSPSWIKERLEAYGIPSINNLVDITNFVMVEYGQPLHAQDLAKLPAAELTLRQAKNNETIETILGTEITLDPTIGIISSGGIPVVITGIVGGAMTAVSASTTDIILDAGNYDSRLIRKTSRKLKIANETVLRTDKFLDPRLTEIALERAATLILELCGGELYMNVDHYPHPVKPQTQALRYSRIKLLSGQEIPAAEVKHLLHSLGYEIVDENLTGIEVEVPYYRTDIEVEDDLVADILRIRDYQNIPASPLSTPIPPEITPELYLFEDRLRDLLVSVGAQEHLTSSLVKASGQPGQLKLANALTADADALRTNCVENLAAVKRNYAKHGLTQVSLFEIGKVFDSTLAFPHEINLATVLTEQASDLLATLLRLLGVAYTLENQGGLTVIRSKSETLGSLHEQYFLLYTEKLMGVSAPYSPVTSTIITSSSLDLSVTTKDSTVFADIRRALETVSPRAETIEVVESYPAKHSLLVRLTWNRPIKEDETRKKLVNTLRDLGLETRSG